MKTQVITAPDSSGQGKGAGASLRQLPVGSLNVTSASQKSASNCYVTTTTLRFPNANSHLEGESPTANAVTREHTQKDATRQQKTVLPFPHENQDFA